MPSVPSIIEFTTDSQLLGLNVSAAQETLQRSIYGLSLTNEQRDIWHECTGREDYPGHPFGEATVIAGARAGKDSRIAAPIVCFEAIFGGHEQYLSRGERGVIPLVAQDQRATKIAFGYIRDYLTRSPLLASMVEEVLAQEIQLRNGVNIFCFPCTLRSLRGYSTPAGVMDEVGYYRLEGQVDSDVEIQASIRRGMINFPVTRLVKISTPYMKSGILFDDFQRAFGHDDPDLLVWRASTVLMNPSILSARLERERRLDPSRFAREYEAEFAEDLEAFLPVAWVEAAVIPGSHEQPPCENRRYIAACDPSGGDADAFTLAVVHVEGQGAERRVVHDMMKSWGRTRSTTVDLEGVVREIASILKRYRCSTVYGDRYSAGWIVERFKAEGLRYEVPEYKMPGYSEPKYLDKATAYLEAEPLFAQGRIELHDHPQLVRELKLLERRPRAGGKTLVDHPSGGHDDHANALCLAAALAARQPTRPWASALTLPAGVTQLGEHGSGFGMASGGQQPTAVGGQAAHINKYYR